jgi:hypothetical protein
MEEQKRKFEISYLVGYPGCGYSCEGNDLNAGDKTHKISYEFFGTRTESDKDIIGFTRISDRLSYTLYNFSISEKEIKSGVEDGL